MSTRHMLYALAGLVAIAVTASIIAAAQPSRATTSPAAATTRVTATAAAGRHHFRGRVTSANRDQRWFRMHTTTDRTVRIYPRAGTSWHGCDWDDMHSGQSVDVRARHSHGYWVASRISTWHRDESGDHHEMW